jgi:hypothetical protein
MSNEGSPICQVDEHDLIYDENGGPKKLGSPLTKWGGLGIGAANRKADQGCHPRDIWSNGPREYEHSNGKGYRRNAGDVEASFLAFAVNIFPGSMVSPGNLRCGDLPLTGIVSLGIY